MAATAPTPAGRIEHDVPVDALTGLMRGGAFESLLNRSITGSPAAQFAVIVIGLDRFQHVNDLLGYGAGDLALYATARRLSGTLCADAGVCRLGGDEFAVYFPACDEPAALLHASIILAAFEQPVHLEGRDIFLSASIGLAVFPRDGACGASLTRRAAAAMHRAKSRGGGAVERAGLDPAFRPEERYRMESALRFALARDQFSLRYQPQVDREGMLQGLEALLVWDHPDLGRIRPETFIHLAEETGDILPIGEWVIAAACRHITGWRATGLQPPRIALNVSPVQFASPGFVDRVTAILKRTGIGGSCLEFELTEGCILRDVDESASHMAEFRSLGIRIAIDDFGVGCSPLTYMHRLPLDVVKIDRTFISQLTGPAGSLPVVHTIAVLAHHRGLQVVAEGVETFDELELVRAARCDLVQGFLFGAPLTHDEVARLLANPSSLGKSFRSPHPSAF
ncbi:MAG: bifunctional diguanylate cyclase/phosphodiesterase [Candidatus Solibacter usitatus]|nr:bifunctional diguanylate cyclase/phosphodiesterase [Candidatus Solibacter usitatus]